MEIMIKKAYNRGQTVYSLKGFLKGLKLKFGSLYTD